MSPRNPEQDEHALPIGARKGPPDGRVLIVSGYTEDLRIRSEIERTGTPFLQKPLSQALLQDTV